VNLTDLCTVEKVDSSLFGRSCLLRHTTKDIGTELEDTESLNFYQSIQDPGKFDRFEFVFCFSVTSEKKTLFRGVFRKTGSEPFTEEVLGRFNPADQVLAEAKKCVGNSTFYHLEKTEILADYIDRLVIDWGGSNISWFQAYHVESPKLVVEIRPVGYFGPFLDHQSVSLSRFELEYLFRNERFNTEWYGQLSKVGGVYVILDESTGAQYVGSAYGKEGLWGRWRTYYEDPTGGNVGLAKVMGARPQAYKQFRYSILDVFPGNTIKEDVLSRESLIKRKLGSRVFGLNEN
jgi:hypothetical protein